MSSTGENLHKLLENTLEGLAIDMKNCIANSSFDGTANMSEEYDSVSSRLTAKNETHIHAWCLAHFINLFISQDAECTVSAI